MTVGWATAEANTILATLDGAWIQLHIGDPGAAGTSNPATNTTRQQISLGTPASASVASDAALTWTNVAGSEDYTHWSAWTASTAGAFRLSGTITANAVATGDTFTIPSGSLTISIPVAA